MRELKQVNYVCNSFNQQAKWKSQTSTNQHSKFYFHQNLKVSYIWNLGLQIRWSQAPSATEATDKDSTNPTFFASTSFHPPGYSNFWFGVKIEWRFGIFLKRIFCFQFAVYVTVFRWQAPNIDKLLPLVNGRKSLSFFAFWPSAHIFVNWIIGIGKLIISFQLLIAQQLTTFSLLPWSTFNCVFGLLI